jgi:hypothetical protein
MGADSSRPPKNPSRVFRQDLLSGMRMSQGFADRICDLETADRYS